MFYDQAEIDEYFETLQEELRQSVLSNRAEEFMLMDVKFGLDENIVSFKHNDTRDYLYLHINAKENFIMIPEEDRPFHTGSFITK